MEVHLVLLKSTANRTVWLELRKFGGTEVIEAKWPGKYRVRGYFKDFKNFYSIIQLLSKFVYQGLDSPSCFK